LIRLSTASISRAAALASGLFWPGVSMAAASPGPGPGQLLQLVLGLLAVIAAVLVLARWLPRLQGMRAAGAGNLKVVEAMALGQKERLLVVQVGDEQILLGVTASGISALHRLDRPLQPPAAGAPADGAPAWLNRVLNRRPS
jgi:flagellar protein FliO/FliZ